MSNPTDRFVAVTGASLELAQQYLSRNNGELEAAIEDFYAREEAAPARPARAARPSGGIRTLRDLDEDDEERTSPNLFTGGEKSALQVENPDKRQPLMVERILQRARDQMGEEDDRDLARAPPATFAGGGYKLGDLHQALEAVAAAPRAPEKATREIVFWRQGFTVGDGPLHRYDDPANVRVLEDLRQGRVPVLILGVDFGQDVDVQVLRRTDEDYEERRPAGGFHGAGQRLGLPVPGEAAPSEAAAEAAPLGAQSAARAPSATAPAGDSPVQIRFANGRRLAWRFNSGDTVALVYAFVRRHEYNDALREFVLSHAFPVLPIAELEQTVGDAKLKNAVIVQRWK